MKNLHPEASAVLGMAFDEHPDRQADMRRDIRDLPSFRLFASDAEFDAAADFTVKAMNGALVSLLDSIVDYDNATQSSPRHGMNTASVAMNLFIKMREQCMAVEQELAKTAARRTHAYIETLSPAEQEAALVETKRHAAALLARMFGGGGDLDDLMARLGGGR